MKLGKYIANRMSNAERTIKRFVPEATGSKHRHIIAASIAVVWKRSDNPLSGE
jgi:hypothetical protein